jgi:hypothetical protein
MMLTQNLKHFATSSLLELTRATARANIVNGLIRRLDTMIRAIDYVYNILPPEKEDIPDADDRVGATILIQSFHQLARMSR